MTPGGWLAQPWLVQASAVSIRLGPEAWLTAGAGVSLGSDGGGGEEGSGGSGLGDDGGDGSGGGGGGGGDGPTALCREGGVSPTALCSWGVTRDDQHRYVVRLAVAAEAEAGEAGEHEGAEGQGGGGNAPRAWSEFVPVERSVTLSLAHPDGEHVLLLRVAVSQPS